MGIKYVFADDVRKEAVKIIETLGWSHIDLNRVGFVRSFGSQSRGTIARCHTIGKAVQVGMGMKKAVYVVEVISKKFDRLPKHEKTKVIIHELMHIPKSFGGGFVHHNKVNDKTVELVYRRYCELKEWEEEI